MNAVAATGAGFLLAVLWFDLMFDVQVLGKGGGVLPEEVLDSIAGYYRRVTTTARPMNRLIVLFMLATFTAIVVEIVREDVATWLAWTSLVLALAPISLAGLRIVPNAERLGAREDTAVKQSDLARSICREHLFCLASIAAVIALQIAA